MKETQQVKRLRQKGTQLLWAIRAREKEHGQECSCLRCWRGEQAWRDLVADAAEAGIRL